MGVLVGCVDKDTVFVDKPFSDEPTETANNFVGYIKPVEDQQTSCGNCHATFQAGWASTGHSQAWETLQSSDDAEESCWGCHTVSENGNLAEGEAGYVLVQDDRYLDVQCESCHGSGWDHVNNPMAENAPLCSIEADTAATTGCGECHQGEHQPFVEQWQESRHSNVRAPSPAGREDCAPCHEGRAALVQKFYETSNYVEKDGEEFMPITCAVCHDPHKTEYPANLRGDIEVSSRDHLCVRCHANRGQPPSRRGPHAAQGLLLIDDDVGWRPAGFESPVVNAHAGLANPKLCVTCHVTMFTVTGTEFESVGHRFEAISCLDETGLPTDGPCANDERDFRACADCHGSEEAALADYEKFLGELNGWLDQLWVDSNQDSIMDATDAGLLPMVVAMGDPLELDPSDELVTVAEGALFNAQLAYTSERTHWADFEVFDVSVSAHKASGNGAHNPWLLQALLEASIEAVIEFYNLGP